MRIIQPTENDRLAEIKSQLEAITIGHITTMHEMVVWRNSKNSWIVGETVGINSPRLDVDAAAARIGIAAELPPTPAS